MMIESVFQNQASIPAKYTCQGQDISPPLKFLSIPKEAKSLVLIVDDPDAPRGTFDHWIVWNIPPTLTALSEGAKELFSDNNQVYQGKNGFGQSTYRGPCPPPGHPHHYHFKLYALNTLLDMPEGSSKEEIEKMMQDFIIDKTELIGIYQR